MSEIVHATAVLAGADGVLIRGDSGTGKSSLAWMMMERGARLIADDRVHLSACHGRVIAAGLGAFAGKLELRGRGIVSVPYERSAVIRLVADLVAEAEMERLPDPPALVVDLLGVTLPRQPVPGDPGHALLLLEAALKALPRQCYTDLRPA
jgi:HPr kinase/phosphorylase